MSSPMSSGGSPGRGGPGGEPGPAYLVRGDDPALVGEAVGHLVHALVGDDAVGLAVEDLSGEDVDVGTVVDACLTPAFLSPRRVVVVREAGRFRAEDVDRLVSYLDDPLPTTSLVLAAGGGQLSPRLTNAVKKVGHVFDASRPREGRARTQWLTSRLHESPLRFDAPAGSLLGEHLGEDLGRLSGLLDALVAAYGEGASVGVEELTPFLGEAGGVAPWDLTDAIDQGRTADALDALHRLVGAGGRHPLVVMATLHRHFAAMLRLDGSGVATDEEAAAALGMQAFPAAKVRRQAGRIGWVGISRAMTLLADADLALRGVAGWPDELVLEVLVARLSRLAGSRRTVAGAARR